MLFRSGDAADLLEPGSHGSTFGGNPVACAAAHAVLDTVEKDDLIGRAKHIGARIQQTLEPLAGVAAVRGEGAMQGVVLHNDIAVDVEAGCRARGVIVNVPLPNVIRLVPPLTITDEELDRGLNRLGEAIAAHDY